MHLYVVARGHIDRLRRWENDVSSKFLPYMVSAGRRNTDNNAWLTLPQWGMFQLSIRPIQLYEIIFPEPCLNEVLSMIQPYGGYGISPKLLKHFRNVLKMGKIELEEIPKVKPDKGVLEIDGNFIPPKNYLNISGIDIMGLGLKRDKDVQIKPVEDL